MMFLALHVSAYEIVIDESLSRADRAILIVPIDKGSYIKPAMIHIKAGSFQMGSDHDDDDEKPVHRVTISQEFYIGKYEVTVGEYRKFIISSNHNTSGSCWYYDNEWKESKTKNWDNPGFSQNEDSPVACVNYNDAKAYTQWLSKKTHQTYRLPTEAEWEYVARAGTTTKYSFGNSDSSLGNYAWYADNSNKKTHKVGTKQPNSWGLYDIHGNVWEWCEDWYTDSYENTPKNGTDNNSGSQNKKVLRGGSWYDSSDYSCSAFRDRVFAAGRYYSGGFRLAGTLP